MGAVLLGGGPPMAPFPAVATIGIRHLPLAASRKRYIRLARRRKGAAFFSCRTRVRSWHLADMERGAEFGSASRGEPDIGGILGCVGRVAGAKPFSMAKFVVEVTSRVPRQGRSPCGLSCTTSSS